MAYFPQNERNNPDRVNIPCSPRLFSLISCRVGFFTANPPIINETVDSLSLDPPYCLTDFTHTLWVKTYHILVFPESAYLFQHDRLFFQERMYYE
ncbi:hypothetical protein KsCSTR_00310 [Candidatus Kuenenia stuttgartiensis]|uniref:Uncharacterized protein n=1 Tax=Kuenenia stuttgartiensis TaxID=174633 RepID=Q1PVB0_KUEST|nr:hypothetical protein KsCSTR_00310 [Candidatus Kuenenia stuttgartiensis]CAJ71159.1 unknown protein [Candidatus Kuenenia stuttgartiensis]